MYFFGLETFDARYCFGSKISGLCHVYFEYPLGCIFALSILNNFQLVIFFLSLFLSVSVLKLYKYIVVAVIFTSKQPKN